MLRLALIAAFLGAACAATPQATQLEQGSIETATNRSHSLSESLLSDTHTAHLPRMLQEREDRSGSWLQSHLIHSAQPSHETFSNTIVH